MESQTTGPRQQESSRTQAKTRFPEAKQAEGARFELADALRRLRFSRPVQSATLPPLRKSGKTLEIVVFLAFSQCSTSSLGSLSESTKVASCPLESAKMFSPPPAVRASSVPVARRIPSRVFLSRRGETSAASLRRSRGRAASDANSAWLASVSNGRQTDEIAHGPFGECHATLHNACRFTTSLCELRYVTIFSDSMSTGLVSTQSVVVYPSRPATDLGG